MKAACDACHAKHEVPDEKVGTWYICKRCSHKFFVRKSETSAGDKPFFMRAPEVAEIDDSVGRSERRVARKPHGRSAGAHRWQIQVVVIAALVVGAVAVWIYISTRWTSGVRNWITAQKDAAT